MLGARYLGGSTTQVFEIDKNGMFVTREVQSDTSTTFLKYFRQASVLFFENEESTFQRGMGRKCLDSKQSVKHGNKRYGVLE